MTSDPVIPVSSWPLVVVIEDCFIPEWSEEIVKSVAATSTEVTGAVIYALAVYAEAGLKGERLN
jgi:hypothetical protein